MDGDRDARPGGGDAADPGPDPVTVITERLTDLAYTGVGLAVIAVNRFQVARRGMQDQLRDSDLDPTLASLFSALEDPDRVTALLRRLRAEVAQLDDRVGGLEGCVAGIADRLEPDLPPGLREIVPALRSIATDHADQIRAVLGLGPR